MTSNNELSARCLNLAQRQWAALGTAHPAVAAGGDERMERYRRDGAITLQTVLAAAGISADDLGRCSVALASDPRLKFLTALPHAAAMGGAYGEAVERSVNGSSSETAREAAALMMMFTRILDSLLDDTPEIIDPERGALWDMLKKARWMEPGDPAAAVDESDAPERHPALVVLRKLMVAWMARMKNSERWGAEESAALRETFAATVETSMKAEFDSLGCRIPAGGGAVDPSVRMILREKSEAVMWAIALAPIFLSGAPATLDSAALEACTRLLGDNFGWIDDTSDLADDLRDGNWNEVLLDMYEGAGSPPFSTREELAGMVSGWLADAAVVDRLVATGVERYAATLHAFDGAVADPLPMQQYTADVSLAWIRPPGA